MNPAPEFPAGILRRIPRGAARVAPIRNFPYLLRELGCAPGPFFARTGFDPLVLEDPGNVMTYRDFGRVLECAAAETGCPHLGLLMAARAGIADLGIVGALLTHAPDVGAALRDAVRFMPLFDRAAVATLAVEREAAIFSYAIVEPDIPAAEQFRELSVGVMVMILRTLCGAAWAPDAVLFPHRARLPLRPYATFFRAPVDFGQGMAGIVFPARWLGRRPFSADATLRRALLAQIVAAPDAADAVFADRVRRQIQIDLPSGRTGEVAVAAALDMERSTLRRRLAREGTSFRAIVQDIQFEAAKHLMRESEMTLSEVASSLGYAELSVFTRAFRRWSGMTPSDWRADLRKV
jgi:AraC-like DNA-binding protein